MIEIIAEIGINHNGDLATAKRLILMAKERFHAGPEMTRYLVAAHGTAYVVGRLLRGTLRWPLGPLPNIALGSLIGAGILLFAVRAPVFPAVVVLYGMAGLCTSLNWPSTLGYAGERFPAQTGTVLGAVNAVSGPGTLAVSLVMGYVSERAGVATGMLIPPAMFFALSLFAVAAHLRSKRAGLLAT